jgi:hypothetical protein
MACVKVAQSILLGIFLLPVSLGISVLATMERSLMGFFLKVAALNDWLRGVKSIVEIEAQAWIDTMQQEEEEGLEITRREVFDVDGKAVAVPVGLEDLPGAGLELRPKRAKFARFVAKQAYFQFGVRENSPANRLVTRKWIRNYLNGDDFKALRLVDKIAAIDEAMPLSFVPSGTWEVVDELAGSKAFGDAVNVRESPIL